MKGNHYSQELKEQILSEVEVVKNVVVVAKKYEIPHSTIHTWLYKRNKKIDFKTDPQIKTELINNEIGQLKKKNLEQETRIQILEDLLKKTYQVWETN